jgi:hypothetical protein
MALLMWATVDKDNRFSRTWAEAQALKDELFRRAKYGEITGDEADAEAVRLGLGSLSRRPGPEEFRPEFETHWTLPMAVAWIAYLDLDEVREWSVPYRAECFNWRWQRWRVGFDGPVHEGWHLEQRHQPTLSLFSLSSIHDGVTGDRELAMPVKNAREALWLALREGFFAANGIDSATGRRVEIPALEWHELVLVEAKNETDEVRRGLLGDGYRDVLFPAAPLRGFWRRPEERPRPTLPPIMPPTGFGYMPLFCAAQWIATEGGKVEIDPANFEVWRAAFEQLLDRISSNEVAISGMRENVRELIDGVVFAGCQIDYPFSDDPTGLGWSEAYYIQSYPYLGDEHWRRGFDDSLRNCDDTRWTQLMVAKGDVRSHWPFSKSPETSTGLPGRPPKAKHLISDEMQRRANESRLAASLAQEAEALLDWLTASHPTAARPTRRTISNNLRADYRRLKDTK